MLRPKFRKYILQIVTVEYTCRDVINNVFEIKIYILLIECISSTYII